MAESSWHVAFVGASAMDYEERPPTPGLEPWVAVSWRMRAREAFDLRILPDGCMDIIGSDVIGSLSGPIVVPFGAGDTASGIRFHPGGSVLVAAMAGSSKPAADDRVCTG